MENNTLKKNSIQALACIWSFVPKHSQFYLDYEYNVVLNDLREYGKLKQKELPMKLYYRGSRFDENPINSKPYCPRCTCQVEKQYSYCPWCGQRIIREEEWKKYENNKI